MTLVAPLALLEGLLAPFHDANDRVDDRVVIDASGHLNARLPGVGSLKDENLFRIPPTTMLGLWVVTMI